MSNMKNLMESIDAIETQAMEDDHTRIEDIDEGREPREVTVKLIDMAEEGVLSWEAIARGCFSYFSEHDIAGMATSEGFVDDYDEDEEEGSPDSDFDNDPDFNW